LIFQWHNPSDRTIALGSTQPLTEMSIRGKGGRCVRLITYHHPVPFSLDLGTLSCWNHLGLSGPVTGLLYLCTVHSDPTKYTREAIYIYTGCPRRNVPDFGRVFLMLKYTDITQNTYIQSWMVTKILAREKWGLLATCTADASRDSAYVLETRMQC